MAVDITNRPRFPLHECVFHDDIRRLSALLRQYDPSEKDVHGNTPLHLAVILGHKECVHLLLNHHAPVKTKNKQGWTPLSEALSYGDRQIIKCLLRKLKSQSKEMLEAKRPELIEALGELVDLYLELKWDFQSWVPLVSRILPSDVCKIYKKGTSIRVDTTLIDFSDMRWQRGDISFIFNGSAKSRNALIVLDNDQRVFQRVSYDQESETELEEEVDILMSSDILAATMSTKPIVFCRAQTGWIFREDRRESVGIFPADFYMVQGLIIESRKRREHLSDEDIQRNKAAVESLSKGEVLDGNTETPYRSSLTPPAPCNITWQEYIMSESIPRIGRPQICKENRKCFKATIAMSEDFPIQVADFLNVLEVITPMKHFAKLREFIELKLPPGFPVKIDIPVLPTISARVTFQDCQFQENIPNNLFRIPSDYKEDPYRFPDL